MASTGGARFLDQKFKRPVVTLTAAIAHGFCCNMFFTDETERGGPNAFCDILVHTLDEVLGMCREKNWRFPDSLVLQADNTTGQCKNNLAMLFLAFLVGSGRFTSATINFLIVGHTHEDVDQVFGMVCDVLKRAGKWTDPAELMGIIQQGLEGTFRARGERLNTWRHAGVRDATGSRRCPSCVGPKLYANACLVVWLPLHLPPRARAHAGRRISNIFLSRAAWSSTMPS